MLGGFAAEAPPPSEECQLFNMEAEVDKLELMVSAREGVLRGNPFFFLFLHPGPRRWDARWSSRKLWVAEAGPGSSSLLLLHRREPPPPGRLVSQPPWGGGKQRGLHPGNAGGNGGRCWKGLFLVLTFLSFKGAAPCAGSVIRVSTKKKWLSWSPKAPKEEREGVVYTRRKGAGW